MPIEGRRNGEYYPLDDKSVLPRARMMNLERGPIK